MHPPLGRQLLAQEAQGDLGDRERVGGVAALVRVEAGVGGAAGVGDVEGAEGERAEVGQLEGAGVDHHRGVHPVERPGFQEERLARTALLGGCADHSYGQAEFVGVRGEAERRADPGGGDQVVAAGVAEAGQRVVLAGDGHGDGSRADRGPERRLQAVGGGGDVKAVCGQEFGAEGGGAVLLEGGLGVGVDAPAEVEQGFRVDRDRVPDGGLESAEPLVDHRAVLCSGVFGSGDGHGSLLAFRDRPGTVACTVGNRLT
ncbi:hypothetical protein SCYAM73S_08651 [Streptomyces cyaneofuscatus]